MSHQQLVDFNYWTLIAQLCNLFIQMYLIKRFLFKPVKKILEQRQAEVDTIYKEADTAREAAETARADYEGHLKVARMEAEEITKKAITTAQERGEEIVREAQSEAARMREKATRDIELERLKTMNELKDEISDIAVDLAAKVVGKEIKEADHEELISRFIDELGE